MKRCGLLALSLPALFTLALTGCGSTYYVYKENLSLLFSSSEKAPLSWQAITASQFDLIAVDTGSNSGTMALAFLEHQQHKFIGADNSFLILQHGRIVRSSGFDNDLLHHSVTDKFPVNDDPLSIASHTMATQLAGSSWQYTQLNKDGNTLLCKTLWSEGVLTSLQVLGANFSVLYFAEQITVTDGSQFTNEFWFSTDGKTLLKTKQFIAPGSAPLDIVFLSRLNRLRTETGML